MTFHFYDILIYLYPILMILGIILAIFTIIVIGKQAVFAETGELVIVDGKLPCLKYSDGTLARVDTTCFGMSETISYLIREKGYGLDAVTGYGEHEAWLSR